jgi:hypothetical protein
MRLLHTDDEGHFSLVEFTGQDIPPYAILSHTWYRDDEEVSFRDMTNGSGQEKIGFKKICLCGSQAASDGLQYFWVDTCCIDKSSSAELTESINSMYQWYSDAVVCYVALMDLPVGGQLAEDLSYCRWFTRGWTLQEMLAPTILKFYDQEWNYVGTKHDLGDLLSDITGVASAVLWQQVKLANISVATKMAWISRRPTKRMEDIAYCMLGIFDVHMPLIYGEGMKAFRRLQEEIIKRNNDLTIFAWQSPAGSEEQFIGALAPSPAVFAGSYNIIQNRFKFTEFSLTNKGLLISSDIRLHVADIGVQAGSPIKGYFIFLGAVKANNRGMYLSKIGPDLFCRNGLLPLAGYRGEIRLGRAFDAAGVHILLDPSYATSAMSSYRLGGLRVPLNEQFELTVPVPETLWDETGRIFLRPKQYDWPQFPMVLVMRFVVTVDHATAPLAVLYHCTPEGPSLKVFSQYQYPEEYEIISQARYRQEGIHVQELDLKARSTRTMANSTMVKFGYIHKHIAASLTSTWMQVGDAPVRTSTLSFAIDGQPIPHRVRGNP